MSQANCWVNDTDQALEDVPNCVTYLSHLPEAM